MKIDIPADAARIIDIFEQNGYEAYVVGGCVRDSILGRNPEDWDITTSATPQQMKELFHKTIDTGIQHGTVTIRMGGCSYETTTYRIDGEYEDSRHPKSVEFTSLLSEDLKRRDFTINAMAYSPKKGLVDLFGGIDDLNNRIIRCVGNPNERFSEDALRTLRAVRFAGQLDFEIEENTLKAIATAAPNIANISVERIRVEITKLIMSAGADRMMIAKETGLTGVFLPEWDKLVCEKKKAEDIIEVINEINNIYEDKGSTEHKILCFAALLHETGKAQEIMQRLKFDNYSINLVDRLTRYCTYDFDMNKVEFRRFLSSAGTDIMELLYILRQAYNVKCTGDYAKYIKEVENKSKNMYNEILEDKDALYIKDLDISGNDLLDAGVPAGKMVGIILNSLLAYVLEKPECNEKRWLLKKAEMILEDMK